MGSENLEKMLPVTDEARGVPVALGTQCEVYYEIVVVL